MSVPSISISPPEGSDDSMILSSPTFASTPGQESLHRTCVASPGFSDGDVDRAATTPDAEQFPQASSHPVTTVAPEDSSLHVPPDTSMPSIMASTTTTTELGQLRARSEDLAGLLRQQQALTQKTLAGTEKAYQLLLSFYERLNNPEWGYVLDEDKPKLAMEVAHIKQDLGKLLRKGEREHARIEKETGRLI